MIENWKKNITIFMIGQGLTLLGSMLAHYAIFWHITLKTQSGVMMLLFTLVQTLPMFFISPFGGVWADRYNKKHLINIADAAIAVVTLIMAIMFMVGFEFIALLLICSAMRSFGQGIQSPAVSALVPEIVPQENLVKVNGLSSSIQYFIMFLSPIIAGGLLSFMSVEVILLLDVVTAIIGISLLYFFVKTKEIEKKDTDVSYFKDLKEGLKYAGSHAFIKRFFILSAIFNIMICPASVLTALHVARDFGSEVWRLTVLESVFFVGAMLGGMIIGIWGGFKNKSHTLALSSFSIGIGILLLGVFTNFWLYIVAMGLVGVIMAIFNVPITSILQTNIEEKYMGRVFSLLSMVSSLLMPLAMVIWGPLSDAVKIDYLLIGSGMVIFFMGFIFIFDKVMLEIGAPKMIEKESE